jgi:tetratricopeptide (TPR) repeat protein
MTHRFFAFAALALLLGCKSAASVSVSGTSVSSPSPSPVAARPAEEAVLEHIVFAKSEARPWPQVQGPRRTTALMLTELEALERLVKVTPIVAPDHDVLLRQIADDYVALEASAREEGRGPLADKACASAIKAYSDFQNGHPKHPQKDELTFFLGYEYERAGDLAKSRELYYELVSLHPESTYAPHAYLSFAELFFDEAPNAPAVWPLAEKAYKRGLDYEPPKNRAYGYAWYKLAWVLQNEGDHAGAVEAFGKANDYVAKYASDPDTLKLADAVKADRAVLGEPSAALER